ncbi:hypothetical protein [Mitsuaria sp. 7]|uniref:hypothetical protein n=1 Tax=Mitsuaria sp. 7 TaxID=1658665 RepID=UPI0007DDD1DB|nr:hypothetical protein [Mitsuaria sp. 7]ANH66567.1 hypothetical protein ABE85_01525 [Mitsuaria sp. 7]
MRRASVIHRAAPAIVRLGVSIALVGLLPLAACAADEPRTLSASDLRWLCQQPSVARVKVTRVAVDAPESVCVGASSGDDCRTVTAEVIVLESLPLLGAAKGLPLKPFASPGPNRVRLQMASREYLALKEPPFALVGVEGLLGMRELPAERYERPAPLRVGVVLPGSLVAQDLDTACKPFRHWSGQQHPALPEQLPGTHPARTENAQQLARRLSGMAGPKPPDAASLEQRFGARLLNVAAPTADGSDFRGLAQLDESWIRLRRRAWSAPTGRSRVNLMVFLTAPYAESRQVPWWEDDPSDQLHKQGDCVRPSMVLKALGDEWPRATLVPPYNGSFVHRYPDYEVRIGFQPHSNPPYPPGQLPNTSDSCIDGMNVFFEPR